MSEGRVVDKICPICGTSSPLFFNLRSCNHISCIPCLHFHLKFNILKREKVRIKCIHKECKERIHENDIRSILDPSKSWLNEITPIDHRVYLIHKHDKHQIFYALGGPDMVRRCPLCKSVYAEVVGCHFVVCANIRCATRFCWQCGNPVKSFAHFNGAFCTIGYDDLWRGIYLFRFLFLTDPFVLIFLTPWVFGLLFVILPSSLIIILPYLVCRTIYKHSTVQSSLLLPDELCIMGIKMILSLMIVIPISIILVPLSLVTSWLSFLLYCVIVVQKMNPHVRRLVGRIDRILCILQLLGLDDWKQMLQDSHEVKERKMIEEMHNRQEISEKNE